MNLEFAKQYCQNRTFKSGSSYYYSFLFLSPVKRQAITALYAFCREIDDIADTCQEVTVAEQKLNWWFQEIDKIFSMQSRHPIGIALAEAIRQFKLPKVLFDELIQGMFMDIRFKGYATFQDLKVYCHCVASTVGLLAVRIFGFQHEETLEYGRYLGLAFQLTNIIRDVFEDFQLGRFYLPQTELAQHNLKTKDIMQSPFSEKAQVFFQEQIERAESYYIKALGYLHPMDKNNQVPGLIMAAIYQSILKIIKTKGLSPHKKRSLSPIKKLWIAWKTYHTYTKVL